MKNFKEKLPYIYIAIGVSVFTIFIYSGFNTQQKEILRCVAVNKKWVQAEYSEINPVVTTDAEGYTHVEMETDYWDEPASEVFVATTVNGQLQREGIAAEKSGYGFYRVANYPVHDLSMSRDSNFERFKKNNVTTTNVYFISDRTSIDVSNYSKCVSMLGKIVEVKRWYEISYKTAGL